MVTQKYFFLQTFARMGLTNDIRIHKENIGLRTFFTRTIRENIMDEILVRSSTGSSRHRKNIFPRSISPVELLVKHKSQFGKMRK